MGKVLVIFGSNSDSAVYDRICAELEKQGIEYEMRVSSAHKTPDDVAQTLAKRYDIVIAGAGLAAHLPGVVASKVLSPVIGVPCPGNYEGLDALLSIAQMPPGIPVLAVGVDQAELSARQAALMLKGYASVNIIGDLEEKAVKKCLDTLKGFGAPFTHGEGPVKDAVNIRFSRFDEPLDESEELVIYCPLLLKDDDKAEAALNLLKHTTHGLWVGAGNGKNAAIAAVEIMALSSQDYLEKLSVYRREMGEKLLKHNEAKDR